MRMVRATAPVRICDIGGWTDTWFAQYGCVFNVAVDPGLTVEITASETKGDERISIESGHLGSFSFSRRGPLRDTRFLLAASVVKSFESEPGVDLHVRISSGVPAASALGTSASLCVALVAALHRLEGRVMTPESIATEAWQGESKLYQTGVQDQYAAALGGVNVIHIDSFPFVRVERLESEKELLEQLESRLLLFSLGSEHHSTHLHEMVIRSLQGIGPEHPPFQKLRAAAAEARRALLAGDFEALGIAMSDNTLAQAELHPALVSPQALNIIRAASAHGAIGWKINGAGGEGGSLTILASPDPAQRQILISAIESSARGVKNIPIKINCDGVVVS